MKRAALYLRVSTDKQTTENQAAALQAVAKARGWEIVETYTDAGISGAKGRDKRPALDKMLKDASRRRYDVLMVWAIDRLGRSLVDLISTVQTLEACAVDLYVDQQSVDTTTPAGKLVFHIFGAIAEFERGMIRERIMAGLARSKAKGRKPGPALDPGKVERARVMLAERTGVLKVAKLVGLGTGTVQKIKAEMARN
jgi:DNA invertase Pin-like site-specific DNA recombinase